MATTILHLSDLHLGEDMIPRAVIRLRPWWKRVAPQVTAGVVSAIQDLKPDYVVISGDIVNKSQEDSFGEASVYLRKLFLDAGFDLKKRVLIIPGNHDVSFYPRKHPDDFQRLKLYRHFLRDLFNESDLEARRHRFCRVDPDAKIIFFCLDSTLKEHAPLAEGEVGSSQRTWVKQKLEMLARQIGSDYSRYAKIAIVHHHVVAIPGTSTSGERFMPLLDAGDVLQLLQKVGFNVVLHGHKHFPHITPLFQSDSGVLTVIGAGTTTCCFLEEQCGQGNNFNLVRVSPESNQLEVQLYRANENGEFVETGGSKTYPLFKIATLGYSTRHMRKAVTIAEDGTKTVTMAIEGLRVEERGKEIKSLPLRVISDVDGSKIVDFDYDRSSVEAHFLARTETAIEGEFVLKRPLISGSPPAGLWYSYVVKDGTAMSQKDLARLYPPGADGEGTGVIILRPTQLLTIEVLFPHGFPTTPDFRIAHLGAEINPNSLRHRNDHDKVLNRYKLEVDSPPIDHHVTVKWTLPTDWP